MASHHSSGVTPSASPGSPERPLEVLLAAGAAVILALVNLVLGVVVLVLAAAIERMLRLGVDRSWVGAMIGFAAAGLLGVVLGVMLTRGGYRIVQRRPGWRGRVVALLVIGLVVAVFNDVVLLGAYLDGAQNLLVAVMALVVTLIGIAALSTRACRGWFAAGS